MPKSHWTILLAAGTLTLATLACATSSSTPSAPAPAQTSAPPATQAGSQATATLASPDFPTVTPIPSSTLIPTPTESPTSTVTRAARTPVATKSAAPAAKLEFTLDDIEWIFSPKRKGDNKVQLTIKLHPKGGVPPYSFVLDPGVVESRVNGLSYTFDWHNCNPWEPHSIIVFSGDGQQSDTVQFIPPPQC
jgi:hypothetical protein